MSEVEAFMGEREMVSCERMSAVISRQKCNEYKRSERYRFYCETCNGGVEMASKFKCGKCMGKEGKNQGRGLCSHCYYQEFRAGTLKYWNAGVYSGPAEEEPGDLSIVGDGSSSEVVAEQLEEERAYEVEGSVAPTKPLLSLLKPTPTLSMTLDFSDDPKLYAALLEHGIDEDQIVELISMLVDGELRRVA